MPTFDIQCKVCEHVFEVIRKINDNHKDTCPQCRSNDTEKIFLAAPAVVFNGEGFEKNRY